VILHVVVYCPIGQIRQSEFVAAGTGTMWIPTPIYERIPQFWLLLGLLFMSSGLYLGFDYDWSKFYYVVGVACCLKSMWIFSKRLAARKPVRNNPTEDLDDAETAA
jgi:hypothetical protein